MDKSLSALTAIVILAVAIVVGCYLVGFNDDKDMSDEENLEGYWYETGYEGYKNNEFISSDTSKKPTAYEYNIQIDHCDMGLLNGYYNGTQFTATYNNGIFTAYNTYDDQKTWMYGCLVGDDLCLAITEQSEDDTTVLYTLYSKDPTTTLKNECSLDIKGIWEIYNSYFINNNTEVEPLGDVVNIVEQHGNVFRGTMEQHINNMAVELGILGALTPYVSGGYTIGYICCNGENWTIAVNDDSLTLRTTMIDDSGVTDLLSACDRSYSRDGESIDEDVIDLEGTSWFSNNTYITEKLPYLNMMNATYKSDLLYIVNIEEQSGTLLKGNVIYAGTKCDMIGYVYGYNCIALCGEYGYNIYGTGCVVDGKLIFNENYGGINKISQYTVFHNMAEDVPYYEGELTGHWYGSYEYNTKDDVYYRSVGTAFGFTEFDIFSVDKNGMVYGSFDAIPMVGIISDDNIWFSITKNDGTMVYFEGYITSTGLIKALISYHYTDDTVSVTCAVYSLENYVHYIPTEFYELDGTWISPNGSSIYYDKDGSHVLLGDELEIDVYDNEIEATIELEYEDAVIECDLIGMYECSKDMIWGTLATEYDYVWDLIYINDTLYLMSAYVSDGIIEITQRAYTKDGSVPADMPTVLLDDTVWKSSGSIMRSAEGDTGNEPITLVISDQYKNLVYGSISFGSWDSQNFIGYTLPYGDDTALYLVNESDPSNHISLILKGDTMEYCATGSFLGISYAMHSTLTEETD